MTDIDNILCKLDILYKNIKDIKEQNKLILNCLNNNTGNLNIEKLEYKINELNVDKLSGALNLGLTAETNDESIKKIIENFNDKCDLDIDTVS